MARIYLTGSGENKGYHTGSGIISLPPRIELREKDNRTGSYPTIARTGDSNFKGTYRAYYDDVNTINFVKSNSIVYPTLLPQNSMWVSGGVSSPNILQGLVTAATSVIGVSDAHVHFTKGENLRPFDDSSAFFDNNSIFYTTGTSQSVLPGFNQRLSSKTIITLDINPSEKSNFFFSTGNLAGENVGSGIGYFNWKTKKWEMLGQTTGSSVDYVNPSAGIRSLAPRAFTSRCEFYPSSPPSTVDQTAAHFGLPTSTSGFPFASHFNATGSQKLSISSSITAPFLLEKVVVEFSASFPAFFDPYGVTGSLGSFYEGPNVYQFFLLNCYSSPINKNIEIVQDLTGSADGKVASKTTQVYTCTQLKDLIWTGEISRYDDASRKSYQWRRDLDIKEEGIRGISAITGTFVVSSSCRTFAFSQGLMTSPIRALGSSTPISQVPLLANKLGGRNLAGISEGRSYIRSTVGVASSGTLYVDDNSATYKYAVPLIATTRFDSPYVLMPGDNLVLGFANQAVISGGPADTTIYSAYSEDEIAKQVVSLCPGKGKLTLYGSLLRGNSPVESELNHPLTSDAIHEDIHYDNPVFDQFDTSPTILLTGSYVDDIVEGTMVTSYSDPFNNFKLTTVGTPPNSPSVRKVISRATQGNVSSGSVQRFVGVTNFFDEEGSRMYDTLVPELSQYFFSKGWGYAQSARDIFFYIGVRSSALISAGSLVPVDWYLSFPFTEAGVSRITKINNLGSRRLETFDPTSGISTGNSSVLTITDQIAIDYQSGIGYTKRTQGMTNSIKAVWGFGDGENNSPKFIDDGSTIISPRIRGFKYGLSNIYPQVQKCYFRKDRYGQFRDMLEQRKYTATISDSSVSIVNYPVTVQFYSRPDREGEGSTQVSPYQTHSQNMSQFCTSSLPYFDADKPFLSTQRSEKGRGNGRERTDYPDFWLKPVEISIR